MFTAKQIRNEIADLLARLVARCGFFERPLITCGKWLCRGRYADSLYREIRVRLTSFLTQQGQAVRGFTFGPVHARFGIGLFTTHMHYFKGVPYEPKTTQALFDILKPGDVFVDIGANHGFFSVLAGLSVGRNGRVVAFEPNPAVFRQLQQCIIDNELDSIATLRQQAVSDLDSESVRLFVSQNPANTGLSTLITPSTISQSSDLSGDLYVQVACRPFDLLAQELELKRIDLMKIDVEGAENSVLLGMDLTLRLHPPKAILMETLEGSSAYGRLRTYGYQVRSLETVTNGFGNFLFFDRKPTKV